MTKIQHKFLKLLLKKSRTSVELCKLLKLKTDPYDVGRFYNAVNHNIEYLTTDFPCVIERYFNIIFDKNTPPGEELYSITAEGKEYFSLRKKEKRIFFVELTGIVLALISTVAVIISLL